jgi:hypothetical protein
MVGILFNSHRNDTLFLGPVSIFLLMVCLREDIEIENFILNKLAWVDCLVFIV